MRKIVTRNHIIGRKGVNAFERFCLNQKPELLWKEETVNDFGIDGEVELVAIKNDGKHYEADISLFLLSTLVSSDLT